MSRPVRFILLLAGAGAAVAVARHLTRRHHTEEAKPFFADSYVPPTPAPVAQEPVVEPSPSWLRSRSWRRAPVVEEPVAEQSYVEAAPIVVQPTPVPEEPVLETAPVEEPAVEPISAPEPVAEAPVVEAPERAGHGGRPRRREPVAEEPVVEDSGRRPSRSPSSRPPPSRSLVAEEPSEVAELVVEPPRSPSPSWRRSSRSRSPGRR